MSTPPRPFLRVLAGPTASGKESTALHLAPLLGAEVLSLDSMKVYRGMDIGTSKVPAAARAAVPHHLVDVADPSEDMSVHRFVALADEAIRAIDARGRRALVVGGTTLYLQGLLRGIFEGAGRDAALRAALEEEARSAGTAPLHARLAAVDPAAAARIHPSDLRRITRALEVHAATGRPISDLQSQWKAAAPRYPHRIVVLGRARADLHARIAARVATMAREGLVDEVRRLLAAPGGLGRTASQAIGTKEVAAHLRGEIGSLEEALEKVRTRTNRLARSQETWLRALPGAVRLEVPAGEPAETTARRAAAAFEGAGPA
jgi:tRNA dimethylallyltransferase